MCYNEVDNCSMLQKSFSFIKLFVREVCIMNIFVSRKFDVSIVVKYGEVYLLFKTA
jgi:hypothetical protein